MLPADYVFGFALAMVGALNFYFGPRIEGERIAMQWDPNGQPTWYAPKRLAMWGMIAFMAAVRLLIWLASTYAPQHVHGAELGIVIFSLIAAGSHLFVLTKARATL
ncbi:MULTISPECIES: DUF1648 domain-containing protein [unclassified Bradyrhizobium]|uniref:DUF1648 domain-containing protein n=1 Tax=unclassified Bradyrhizobium TaxID=2631580 RepID=UPI001FF7A833|nr:MULTISPECIES: DUF1648 domain-containing protein [unclassified Bradyrhizobium]MCK1521359.1 hypothetical protein [Bradyrhizobium sp. 17]MCK1684810.1 hypothetical protein [Bradyrhizobium sp. 145]